MYYDFLLLRENPPRQVISISPAYNYSAIRPAQPFVEPTSGYSMFLMQNTRYFVTAIFAVLSSFNIFFLITTSSLGQPLLQLTM